MNLSPGMFQDLSEVFKFLVFLIWPINSDHTLHTLNPLLTLSSTLKKNFNHQGKPVHALRVC